MNNTRILKNAKRILIIGSPGSGKTLFARQLAQQLNLPLISLDDYYIQKNWQKLDETAWQVKLNELINKPCWIIEGNYASSLPERLCYCQSVIMLESPALLCLWRVTMRGFKRMLGDKDSLPSSVKLDPDYRPAFSIDIKFIKLVIFFKLFTKPKMKKILKESRIPKIVLTKKDKMYLLDQLNYSQ